MTVLGRSLRVRFSLRFFFVLLTGTILLIAYTAFCSKRAIEQRRAVAELESWGAEIYYAPPSSSRWPAWLRQALGELYFERVDRVSLVSHSPRRVARPETLTVLARLPYLERVHLDAAFVRMDALQHSQELQGTGLRSFHFRNHMPGDGANLRHLASLTALEELSLERCRLGPDGLSFLSSLANLRSLSLVNCAVRDDDLKYVGALSDLGYLDLARTWITDKGLVHLATLHELKMLRLTGTKLDGDGLANLVGLPKLEVLDLNNTRIDGACLDSLKLMTNLEELWVKGTGLTSDEVAELQAALPRCVVRHPSTYPELRSFFVPRWPEPIP